MVINNKQYRTGYSVLISILSIIMIMILGLYTYIISSTLERIGTIPLGALNTVLILAGLFVFIASATVCVVEIRYLMKISNSKD